MRLLCAADLHLGRRPTRVPDTLLGSPDLAAAMTPQAAWRSLVEHAVRERVDAVLLAGDLLDDEYDFFGMYAELRTGAERLVAAGIEVVAVSGNHDVAVLPRLAAVVPGVKLLGQGGGWEVVTLTDATTTVHVAGWSYPSAVVTSSPVPHLVGALAGLPEARVIGLLHCDRDQQGSRYAPVTSSELAAAPVAVWLLGHVHKPDLGVPAGSGGGGWVRGGQLGGYLGSLSPGDPGEEGPRGAWLVEITADAVGASHVPLAGLRYETLVLDVGGLDDPAALGPLVVSSVSEFVTSLIAEAPAEAVALRALGVRLRLVGRSPVRAELAARLVHDDPREAVIHVGGVAAFIHDVRLEALPAIDLSAVAAGRDPLALAARKLLLLGEPTNPATAALIAAARAHLAGVAGGKYYTALADLDLSDAAVTERLRVAALALIDGMDQ